MEIRSPSVLLAKRWSIPWLRGLLVLEDAILLLYLGLMWLLLLLSGAGQAGAALSWSLVGCGTLLTGVCFLKRGAIGVPRWLRESAYRGTLVGIVGYNYLLLRSLLPLLRSDSVDAQLAAIDLGLFGALPALWFERFNGLAAVEWFSFFYFSYFFVCAGYVLVVGWLLPPSRLGSEFAIGSVLVICLGQLGYVLVPGFGPVGYLAGQFEGPLQGGFFWGLVEGMVARGGAMKDIFPSLHTALPLWFACHAWRRSRRDRRWLIPAFVTAFIAANIIVSTMFLRWHHGVDVVAGIGLALLATRLAPLLASHDIRWRARSGLACHRSGRLLSPPAAS